jgi:hypothetical protein
MLNKGEVLNKPHAYVVCTVCHKMNLFWEHFGISTVHIQNGRCIVQFPWYELRSEQTFVSNVFKGFRIASPRSTVRILFFRFLILANT